jgi:hypothetical protein
MQKLSESSASPHLRAPLQASQSSVNPWALVFALTFPSAFTFIYFATLADTPLQYWVYTPGKIIQFGLPVVVMWANGWRPRCSLRVPRGELWTGIASGCLIVVTGALLYTTTLSSGSRSSTHACTPR